LPILVF